jgi:hypothetical protein
MRTLLWLCCVAMGAQEIGHAPALARVLDREGRLTAVYGLAGNFAAGEPGEALLAYANDGEYEWRLAEGLLSVTHAGRTVTSATAAMAAEFRGAYAVLEGQAVRLEGEAIVPAAEAPAPERTIAWAEGWLMVRQADGTEERVECAREPGAWRAAAADWAHARIDGQSYLLRLTPGRVALYVLPERRRP